MNRRMILKWIFSGMIFFALSVSALSANDAVSRMRERLPQIDALKSAGMVGENNEGMLSARTVLNANQTALIEAENADRAEIYAVVARRSGQSVKEVGQQRAVRIAQQALPGVLLQDADGNWFTKPK